MNRAIYILMVILTLLVLTGPAASAKEPVTIPQIAEDAQVRVRTIEDLGRWQQGKFVEANGKEVVLRIDGKIHRIDMAGMADFQIRTKAGNRAGAGAGLGAVLGGVAGLAAMASLANDDFFNVETSDVIAGGVVCATGGALVGALIGSAIPGHEWEDVHGWYMNMRVAPDGSPVAGLSFRF